MTPKMHSSHSRIISKLPTEMAAAKLIQMGVHSSYDFRLLVLQQGRFKKIQRPLDVPGDPLGFYDEVESWDEFFSMGQKYLEDGNEVPEIPTYIELRKIVRTKKISTQYKFNQMLKQGELPPNTPKYPDRFYKDWKGWDEFLHPTERFLPYSEAKRVMHTLNLRSSTEWREFCRAGKRPDNIPALPHRDYPDFVSWADFLGYEKKKENSVRNQV